MTLSASLLMEETTSYVQLSMHTQTYQGSDAWYMFNESVLQKPPYIVSVSRIPCSIRKAGLLALLVLFPAIWKYVSVCFRCCGLLQNI